MMAALKRNGDRDYCLSENDKVLMAELKEFCEAISRTDRTGQL